MLVRPVWISRARISTISPMATGLWNVMPLTATVTQGSPLHPAAHAPAPSVHPLHHGTAVDVPIHVPVFRAGKEAHRELAISSWHGFLLKGTPQACQMNGRR